MVRKSLLYCLIYKLILLNFSAFALQQAESVVKLNENINSYAEETLPLLSPSGDSLFFARVFHEENTGGKYSGADIWVSVLDPNTQKWSKATKPVQKWNDKSNNFIIGINPDANIMYQNDSKNPEKGILFVKKLNDYWTKPQTIALEGIHKNGYQGMYVSPDYSVILMALKTEDGSEKEDLYVITKNSDGDWGRPINLGSTINSSESEISPFLSVDKKTLYFSSKGHGGSGDMDIFMSERLYNSWTVWSKPKNLGEHINSKSFDGYYSQYGDSIAFFSSNRESQLANLYQVKINDSPSQVTAKTLLKESPKTKAYLSNEDIIDYFGFSFSPSVNFIKSSPEITKESEELLYFIQNKMTEMKFLHLALIYNHSNVSLKERRLEAVAGFLRNLNIPDNRITISNSHTEEHISDFQIKFYTTIERN